MRVAINPHFFRQWYDRLATPVFYTYSYWFGNTSETVRADPYTISEGKFALFLSLMIGASRVQVTGYCGYITASLRVALREVPTAYYTVWEHSFKVGPKERYAYCEIGNVGFLREGDKVRWEMSNDSQGGLTYVFLHLWMVEYLFEG